MAVRAGVESELERLLDRHDPLAAVDLRGESPQEGRLAGIHGPGNHDVLAGPDRRGKQRGQSVVHRPHGAECVEREIGEPVPSDRHRRSARHGHDRREPRSSGQLEIQLGSGRVEPTLGQAEPSGRRTQQIDEFVVGVGHGIHQSLGPVGEGRPDSVAAVDVDVLDALVVDERLEPTETEQGIEHCLRDLLFFHRGPRHIRRIPVERGEGVHVHEGPLSGEFPPVVTVEDGCAIVGQVLGHAAPDTGGQCLAHRAAAPGRTDATGSARPTTSAAPALPMAGMSTAGAAISGPSRPTPWPDPRPGFRVAAFSRAGSVQLPGVPGSSCPARASAIRRAEANRRERSRRRPAPDAPLATAAAAGSRGTSPSDGIPTKEPTSSPEGDPFPTTTRPSRLPVQSTSAAAFARACSAPAGSPLTTSRAPSHERSQELVQAVGPSAPGLTRPRSTTFRPGALRTIAASDEPSIGNPISVCTDQHRKSTGEMLEMGTERNPVSPATCRRLERGPSHRRGQPEPRRQITSRTVSFDDHHRTRRGPGGRQQARESGHPGRTLQGQNAQDGHDDGPA